MRALRQRLLLVAGWAVAAVATGLVSAGAVAVAGGQVTDRPLQPLSAAEVAALPVTIEDPCVTSEPLASGGSASLASCPDRVGSGGPFAPGDVAARPAEKEDAEARALPPLDPEEAAAIADAEAEIEEEVETPQLGPRPPEAQVLDLVGGSVSVTLLEDAIVLNAATPKPGFVADLSFERADELTITFWNGTTLYAVVASITADGELDLAWEETGR